MGNFERKTKKHDSTCQIRLRTLQTRFREGNFFYGKKKRYGVEPTSSINYTDRALDELVGEREKGGRKAERCGMLRLTSPARLFLASHDPAHADVAAAGTALPSTSHAAVPPRPAVCAAFGLG